MLASKMNGVPSFEMFPIHRRDGNAIRLKFVQGGLQAREIVFVSKNDDVAVPTKLGPAVKHARLTAHKQVPNPVG
ncbi:MAG: hypothetical protein AAGJ40_10565 [Planctomycetota bacterium]